MRDLDQDSRTVAGLCVGAGRAAVRQIDEHLQAALDDPVRRATVDVADEADAARVVFEPGIIQALPLGQA